MSSINTFKINNTITSSDVTIEGGKNKKYNAYCIDTIPIYRDGNFDTYDDLIIDDEGIDDGSILIFDKTQKVWKYNTINGTGPAGADGPAGPAGADGADGADGLQGPAGADGGDSWYQLGQDLIGDAGDTSGRSVSLSDDGTIVAIGGYDEGDFDGRTRIYQYSSNTWSQLGQDLVGDTGDASGNSVSLSADGTIVAIGEFSHDVGTNTNEGRTKIYQYSSNTSTWSQLGQDLIGDADDRSGRSVSLSADGTTVAIGASNHDGGKGRTKIYQYSSNTWSQLGQDLIGDPGNWSGWSVSLSADGTIVAIGEFSDDGFKGRTRIYEYSSNTWSQLGQDLIGDFTIKLGEQSVSLSADGTTVAIGEFIYDGGKGRTRIYQYSSNTSTWSKLGQDLIGGDPGDESGWSVSLSADGTIVAIGAYKHDGGKGRTRIYQYSSNGWSQLGQDLVGDPGDYSGRSVSLSADGTTVSIGEFSHDVDTNTNEGRTRIYHLSAYFKSDVKIDNNLIVKGDVKIDNNLIVLGDITASGTVSGSSDDRIKFNEQKIDNSLNLIKKLNIVKYDKLYEDINLNLTDEEFNLKKDNLKYCKEIGIIAQELQNIDDLKFVVSGGETQIITNDDGTETEKENIYTVAYNNLFNLHIKATQELLLKVENLETELRTLK
jgi:hypothetical protein